MAALATQPWIRRAAGWSSALPAVRLALPPGASPARQLAGQYLRGGQTAPVDDGPRLGQGPASPCVDPR